jgi:hypothetical protein
MDIRKVLILVATGFLLVGTLMSAWEGSALWSITHLIEYGGVHIDDKIDGTRTTDSIDYNVDVLPNERDNITTVRSYGGWGI